MSSGSEDNFKKRREKPSIKLDRVIQRLACHFEAANYPKLRFYEISENLIVPVAIGKNKSAKLLHKTKIYKKVKDFAPSLRDEFAVTYSDNSLDILFLTSESLKRVYDTLHYSKELRFEEEIKTIAFKSDPSFAFYRLGFDLTDTPAPTPTWDVMLDNFTNAQALKMFIGSLFINDSDRSQYLWVYGKGGNGKSTIAKVISRALGEFVRFDQVPAKSGDSGYDKYWSHGLLGKRLIVLDDCNNYGFVKSGLFKGATGSGKVKVEKKFGDGTDAVLNCKFMFTSNEKPTVSNDRADQRRIIFSSAKNQEDFAYDAKFEARLGDELDGFLLDCIKLYQTVCGDGRPIPTDTTEALQLAEDFDEEIASWIDKNFEYNQEACVPIADFLAMLGQSSATRNVNKKRVYEYLLRQNVDKAVVQNTRVLVGLRARVLGFGRFS